MDPVDSQGEGEPVDAATLEKHHRALHTRLDALEGILTKQTRGLEHVLVPAWRRVTAGETRWPVTLAVLAALAMQASLPAHLVLGNRWILPAVGGLFLVALVAANPRRIDRRSRALRVLSLALIGTISLANAYSGARLVVGLITKSEHPDATSLLLEGGAIWLTNIITFALWYWEFDRGGPVARAQAERQFPDFMFPQMESPKLAPENWEPRFVDYLYLSFTNAAAFSPTDVMPLSRWAKLIMLLQSAVSLMTVALVVARAVNVL